MIVSPVDPPRQRRPMTRGGAAIALLAALLAFATSARASADTPAPPSRRGNAMSRYYDAIAIARPANDATIFDNDGNLEVTVVISPALRPGDRIVLSLDGTPMREDSGTRFELSGIARGEHKLRARAVDGQGNMLISSTAVSFHLWHASRLFPNRRKE